MTTHNYWLDTKLHVCLPPNENSDWTCECGQFFPQLFDVEFPANRTIVEHLITAIGDYAFRVTNHTARQNLLTIVDELNQLIKEKP